MSCTRTCFVPFRSRLLTLREQRYSELSTPTSEDAANCDSSSIYEDCVCGARCSYADVVPPEHGRLIQRLNSPDYRLTFLYEEFDGPAYGQYCLAKYLDKQRAEMMGPQKLVFEHPSLLPWPSRTHPPTETFELPTLPATADPPPAVIISPPRSRLQRLQQCIVDELENAVAVLCIGLIIYTCIFLFFLYNVFTRGLLRSH